MRSLFVLAVAATLATPAFAGDRTGYQAIAKGDLRSAEATLSAERRIFPKRPELLLNLAAVYSRTGRPEAARALYDQVLSQPDASMLMPSGADASSHDVAERGMSQINAPMVANR